MKRVMVIGGPGWRIAPEGEWERLMAELAARGEWIMDGGYRSTFHIRMPRADTVIWLDPPRRIAFPRVLRRIALGYGRVRADMAPGCSERLDWEFLRWAWTFRRTHTEKYRQALVEYANHANVYMFTGRRGASRFLETLKP